jgi:hypothetical protein
VRLRTDVHTAFDAIAPATGGMAERIVESARAQARIQNGRRRFMLRMRAPLALVAALLLIAIIAAVVVGGRLWQSWSAPHTPIHVGAALPTLQELEARPWLHQLLAAHESCVSSPFAGPVWAYPDTETASGWGTYSGGHFVLAKGFSGLLLVRARDARSGTRSIFANQNAGGPVIGADTVDGVTLDQHPEAVFDASDPAVIADSTGEKTFLMTIGTKHPFSGCFQWQVDGTFKGKPFAGHSYFSGPPG